MDDHVIVDLSIHPKAAENFNTKAEALLLLLAPEPEGIDPPRQDPFKPDWHITAVIDAKDIKDLELRHSDVTGRTVARWFIANEKKLGLHNDNYTSLRRLSEQLQMSKELRTVVTVETVERAIFTWMAERYHGKTTRTMTAYVLSDVSKRVKDVEVWIPISDLVLQSELFLSPIRFRTLSKETIAEWKEKCVRNHGEEALAKFNDWLDRSRNMLRGHAAATISLIAEPDRAAEVAFEQTERTLAILRFFHPSNGIPGVVCYCTPLGLEKSEYRTYVVIGEGHANSYEGETDLSRSHWVYSDIKARRCIEGGLLVLHELVSIETKTEFQKTLTDALLLYSRNSLAKNLSDKLIYAFTALDSFLLLDANESIQQNIADRIAFTIERSPGKRMEIVATVKAAYNLRSKFIHHAKEVDDLDTLRRFLPIVWAFFLCLIMQHTRYKTRADFSDEIRHKMYS